MIFAFLARARIHARMSTSHTMTDGAGEFESFHVEQVPGAVSARCRIVDDEASDIRHILVDGTAAFQYPLLDKHAEKLVWIQVHLCGFATQRQIAEANSFSQRSFAYWLARYRREGAAGLVDKPRPGAPRKVTDKILGRIYSLRDQRLKVREIAKALHLSGSSVEQALHARKIAAEAAAPLLFGDQDIPAVQPPPSASAARAAPEPVPPPEATDEPAFASAAPEAPEGGCLSPGGATPAPPPDTLETVPEARPDELEDRLARNRDGERILAYNGALQDAPPLFRNEEHVDFAGAFMAVVCLATDPLLDSATRRYGQFKAAFYGTRTIFLTLVLMLLLRHVRVEHLKRLRPGSLGSVLGLDRSPEAKTMRRRMTQLAERGLGAELMGDLAAARHASDTHLVYIDDHVQVYSGAKRLGKVFCNRTKQVHKGRTEQWAHGADGTALFVVESEFNETLTDMMPETIGRLCEILEVDHLDLVFDRGGYAGKFLADLKASGKCDFTVYRRGPYEDIPAEKLTFERTTIGNRAYACRPYDHDVRINLYEDVLGESGKTSRKVTGTLPLREIRLVLEDGRQVAVLTTHKRDKVSAQDIVLRPQGRWGNQENMFKYMRDNFDLDGLWSYRADPIDDESLDHPHPDRKAVEKKLAGARSKRDRIYRRYGRMLLNYGHASDPEAVERALSRANGRDRSTLDQIDEDIARLRRELDEKPLRETAQQGGFHTLWSQMRLLQNAVILSADHLERRLASLLGDDYSRSEDEGRALVAAALRTSGAVRLAPGKILVELHPQSSAHRTRAVNALCERLTAMRERYPGSARVIEFVPATAPLPPCHHRWNPRPKDAT